MLGNRINISAPLIASLVAIAICGLVVMLYLVDIAAAVLGPGTGDIEPDAKLSLYVAEHEQKMEEFAERFDGRSVFYIPPVRQPPQTVVTRTPEQERDPAPYVAPLPPEPEVLRYTGPSPIFAVGSEVWFERPRPDEPQMRLRVGETAHNVKLVSVSLPSFITVEFKDTEFDLDMLGTYFGGYKNDDNGTEDFILEANTREKPMPGIVVISPKGETPLEDDQPTLTASDLETSGDQNNNPADMMARPEPIPSNISFEFAKPHIEDDDNDAADASTQEDAQPTQPIEQSEDVWYGPPIPAALLERHTNASMAPPPANDDADEAVTVTTTMNDSAQLPPRDLEAEDEAAQAGDPEADAQADAEASDQSDDDQSEQDAPAAPEQPAGPPE